MTVEVASSTGVGVGAAKVLAARARTVKMAEYCILACLRNVLVEMSWESCWLDWLESDLVVIAV